MSDVINIGDAVRARTRHELKTWPAYFAAIISGAAPVVVRRNDRDFAPGDELLLGEWDPAASKHTGRYRLCDVTYVMHGGQWGIADGVVVMGIDIRRTEAESTAHWHRKATDLEAALARVTAERDDWQRVAGDYLNSRDQALAIWSATRDERDDARRIVDKVTAELRRACRGFQTIAAERDAALAQVAALQEAVAENGRLRAEATYVYDERDKLRAEVARLRTVATQAREYAERLVAQIAQMRADAEAATLEYIAARDAQEGDRIAAWAEASGLRVCERDWYPCCDPRADMLAHPDGTPMSLCDACLDDDERAVPAKCGGCSLMSGCRDYRGLSYCTHPERTGMTVFEYEAPPDKCPLRIAATRDERASAEEGDDGK